MDPLIVNILTALGSNYFAAFTYDTVKHFFETAFKLKPSLQEDLKNAQTSQQLEQVFEDAVGVIEAKAANGRIEVDNAMLSAMKGITFDHQHGQVTIGDSTIQAAVLVTGGSPGATGATYIGGGTDLRSKGTSIQVGRGGSFNMTGGASTKQT